MLNIDKFIPVDYGTTGFQDIELEQLNSSFFQTIQKSMPEKFLIQ
jgi:hypothetical protein